MTPSYPQMHIGLDPGQSGGLAIVSHTGALMHVTAMPATEHDLFEWLNDRVCAGDNVHAVLERVHSMPKQGVASAFTFGRNYGTLLMLLTACEIPFDLVTPQKWQQVMGCLTHGDKNISKQRAQQLFPKEKITHAIADALLIAEFCRRMRVGSDGKTQQTQEGTAVRQRGQEPNGPIAKAVGRTGIEISAEVAQAVSAQATRATRH